MVLTDQDSSQNQDFLLESQDLMDTEDSSLNIVDQEETKIVIDHNQTRELHSLQEPPSITVQDVIVETVIK